MFPITQTEKGVVFRILVQPRAAHRQIVGMQDDRLKIRVTAPPVEGKANEELIRLLAEALGVGRDQVTIIGGHKGRNKTVAVAGIKIEDVQAAIARDDGKGDGRH